MTSENPSSGENSRDVASRRIQHDVSDLLRNAAQDDVSRMPQDVSDRIRGLMASEFGTTFTEEPKMSGETHEETPLIVALPARQQADVPKRQKSRTSASSEGATVHSFEAAKTRREGRRRNVWAASAAAAAAVLVGGVGIGVMNEQGVSAAGKGTSSPVHTSRGALNVRDVRITATGTEYTAANLANQVSQSAGSTAAVPPSLAAYPMATKQGVNSCVNALNPSISGEKIIINADFGRYEGQSAVALTLLDGAKKIVWVVHPDCKQGASNVLAGPITLKP